MPSADVYARDRRSRGADLRSGVDDPARFTFSKKVGPWIGLTPSRNQSGERDVSGGITKAGDVNLRRALCQAATVLMHRGRSTWLEGQLRSPGAVVQSAPWSPWYGGSG